MAISLSLLVSLVVVLASILVAFELPKEKEERNAALHHHRLLQTKIFGAYFDFQTFPGDSRLCANNVTNWYDTIDPLLSFDDYYDTIRNTASIQPFNNNCSLCFPEESLDYDNRVPRMDYARPIQYVSKRWDENGTTIFYDSSYECEVMGLEEHVDDGNIRISEGLCWAICPLKLPTVEQVNVCRLPEEGPGAMERFQPGLTGNAAATPGWPILKDKIDSNRPGYIPWGDRAEIFNNSCLDNTVDCPNCNRLRGDIPVGPLKQDRLWALGVSYLPVASMYITYKEQYDAYTPSEQYNWDWIGSMFFATTVLTSIGYGSFAPHTESSKLLISFVAIPAIALFGVCILNIARFIIIFITELKRAPLMRPVFEKLRQYIRHAAGHTGAKIVEHKLVFETQELGELIRKYDTDRSGRLSEEELRKAVLSLQGFVDEADEADERDGEYASPLLAGDKGNSKEGKELRSAGRERRSSTVEIRAHATIVLMKLLNEEYAAQHMKVDSSSGEQLITNTSADAAKVVTEIDIVDGVLVLNAVAQRYNEWCLLDTQRRANETHEDEVQEDLYVVLALVGLTLIGGVLIFAAVEPGWGFTNAFYFCVCTSTSIGFGDYAPSWHRPEVFFVWCVYVLLSLGFVTAIINKISEGSTVAAAATAAAATAAAAPAAAAAAAAAPAAAAAGGTGTTEKLTNGPCGTAQPSRRVFPQQIDPVIGFTDGTPRTGALQLQPAA
jgi:hypothetical protein